ncbi:hypothetical protein LX70_02641 [Defluviimonas denitrificans]|jgi:hypothetical protein|uniref:Uncharacterized protein n=1 Tax=Albidovulum denitrificans TaxID=404881 RepID=A0A2S8S6F9_9RHOB|nr:hypothetical protein [Defluviimonas denitrificans]PQV56375.1 hypothetical protein LX70_02641 [Defluviimonas denitrificans]
MKRPMNEPQPTPDDVLTAKETAIVTTLVEQALVDLDYHDALQVAAWNMLGFTAARQGVPVEHIIDKLRPVAQSARDHYVRQVAQ